VQELQNNDLGRFSVSLARDRGNKNREWLAQVDFWEGVKEFILQRNPLSSRPIDQLY